MDLTSLPIVSGGATAILSMFVMLIFWGKIVPKSTVDDIRTQYEAENTKLRADRDQWQTAYNDERKLTGELVQQVRTLMEVAYTADTVISALPAAGTRSTGGRNDMASS